MSNALPMESLTEAQLQRKLAFHDHINHDYVVKGFLGKGAFGEVFKVQHKIDKKFYALKSVILDSDVKAERARKEVAALSKLSHRNIVKYTISTSDSVKEPLAPPPIEEQEYPSSSSYSRSHVGRMEAPTADEDLSWTYGVEDRDCDTSRQGSGSSSEKKSESSSTGNLHGLGDYSSAFPELPSSVNREYLYIVMEYCEGGALSDMMHTDLWFEDAKMPWRISSDVLNGLHYIHRNKMIHRDLCPPNIFLDGNSNAKIGDFGLATLGDYEETSEGKWLQKSPVEVVADIGSHKYGMYLYKAPELKSNRGQHQVTFTQKVDIFSFGVILLEMLAGRFGSEYQKQDGVDDFVENGVPEIVNGRPISPWDRSLLRVLLHKDPKERMNAMDILEEVAHKLEDV